MINLSFTCSIKQGKGLSCPQANLVAELLAQAWQQPIPGHQGTTTNPHHAYEFRLMSPKDWAYCGLIQLLIQSYCDDNARYIIAQSIKDLIERVQGCILQVANFTLLTQIGCKTIKTLLSILGTPIGTTMPDFYCLAWSYQHARPVYEKIQVRVQVTHWAHLIPKKERSKEITK